MDLEMEAESPKIRLFKQGLSFFLVGTAKINCPWRRDGPSLAIKFLTLQKRLGHYKWKL